MPKRPSQTAPAGQPESRKPHRARRSSSASRSLRWRLGGFLAVGVLVIGAAAALLWPSGQADAVGAVPVRIDMAGFEPTTLQATVGVPVKLRLVNPDSQFHTDGGGKHQFAIPELGVDTIVQPKSEQVISFTPTQPGTYTFYCDVCCGGKENPSMQGTLKVSAA